MPDLIFCHELTHERTVIGTIGRARRKWQRFYSWYPVEQRRVYSEMDRVYREERARLDPIWFKKYALERRLNSRILNDIGDQNTDKEDFGKFKDLYPVTEKYNRLPLLYYDEECGKPGFCQLLGQEVKKP